MHELPSPLLRRRPIVLLFLTNLHAVRLRSSVLQHLQRNGQVGGGCQCQDGSVALCRRCEGAAATRHAAEVEGGGGRHADELAVDGVINAPHGAGGVCVRWGDARGLSNGSRQQVIGACVQVLLMIYGY